MRNRFALAAAFGLCVVMAAASVGFGQAPQRNIGSQPSSAGGSSKTLEFYNSEFRVECLRKIDVAAQADGLIQEMAVEEGSAVPKDGILFRIDNRVAQSQVDVASRKLESAQKKAEQDAEVRFAEATYEVAQNEYDKELQMFSKRVTSEIAVRRKGLEAKKAMLQIEVASVTHQTDQLAALVAQAEQNAAKVQLGLYDIVAPWDAYVNERMKDQGAWIKAGEPVLKIHHMAEMKVNGYVKIKDIYDRGLSIQSLEGAKIRVAVDITPNQQHLAESTISFVSSDIDNSDRVRVSAKIKNEQIGKSWILRDGLPARVMIIVD